MKKLIPALMTCTVLVMAASIGPEARPVSLPEGHEFTNPDRQVFSISPDGTQLAYVAKASLFIEPLGGGEPINVSRPLAESGAARCRISERSRRAPPPHAGKACALDRFKFPV